MEVPYIPKLHDARRVRVERALAGLRLGFSSAQIIRDLMDEYGIAYDTSSVDVVEARRLIREAIPKDVADRKAEQIERLSGDIGRLRVLARAKGPSLDERRRLEDTLTRKEKLYAEVAGTLSPIQVEISGDVQIRVGIAAIIAELTPERSTRLVEEAIVARGNVVERKEAS